MKPTNEMKYKIEHTIIQYNNVHKLSTMHADIKCLGSLGLATSSQQFGNDLQCKII